MELLSTYEKDNLWFGSRQHRSATPIPPLTELLWFLLFDA